MKTLKQILLNIWRHPKTSAAGIATLVGIALAAASNPAVLAQPTTIATAITAIGLIVAADDTARPAQ